MIKKLMRMAIWMSFPDLIGESSPSLDTPVTPEYDETERLLTSRNDTSSSCNVFLLMIILVTARFL